LAAERGVLWLRETMHRARQRMKRFRLGGSPRFGDLQRLSPISREFGFDRGLPIDRFYIERFLAAHAHQIRGAVLEIGEPAYARRLGQARVTSCDVLHVEAGHPGVTLVADLADADHLPSSTFDCIVFTQTLQFIYDVHAAVRTLHRMLTPGGVLLATVPGICQISRFDMDRWGDYWRFTSLSMRRLLEEVFPPAQVAVEARGNVLAAVALLHGLAAEELLEEELDVRDADYEVLITGVAVK
jgi:SAM-dependent methyltransferase